MFTTYHLFFWIKYNLPKQQSLSIFFTDKCLKYWEKLMAYDMYLRKIYWLYQIVFVIAVEIP